MFTPFVVFGAAKSGTTWMQRIIHAHPECHCHFQIPLFPLSEKGRQAFRPENIHTIYGKSDSPYEGVFESKEEEREYFWKNYFLKRLPILQRDNFKKWLTNPEDKAEQTYLQAFYSKILASAGEAILRDQADPGKVVVGTKAVTDLEQLFFAFPQARVVTIVRDGRDVVVSKRHHTIRMGAYMHGDEKSKIHYWINSNLLARKALYVANKRLQFIRPQKHFKDLSKPENLLNREVIVKYATEWARKVDYIQEFQDRYPDRFHRVHYEDLLADPKKEMESLFRFLGVDTRPETIDQVFQATDFKSMQKTGSGSFFRKGQAGEWAKYFSAEHKALFKKIGGQSLIRLGYEKDMNW